MSSSTYARLELKDEEIPPPFRRSSKGGIYCDFDELPSEIIQKGLTKENGSRVQHTNPRFDVRVWETTDSTNNKIKHLCFLDSHRENGKGITSGFKKRARVNNIQLFPAEVANDVLKKDRNMEFHSVIPFENKPIVVLVSREGQQQQQQQQQQFANPNPDVAQVMKKLQDDIAKKAEEIRQKNIKISELEEALSAQNFQSAKNYQPQQQQQQPPAQQQSQQQGESEYSW